MDLLSGCLVLRSEQSRHLLLDRLSQLSAVQFTLPGFTTDRKSVV